MFRAVCLSIVFCMTFQFEVTLLGQAGPSQEAQVGIAAEVDAQVAGIVPGPTLQTAKATYLVGYGVVVTVEVAFERPRNPFSGARTPDEIRRSSEMHRSQLKEMAVRLIGERVSEVDGLAADETVDDRHLHAEHQPGRRAGPSHPASCVCAEARRCRSALGANITERLQRPCLDTRILTLESIIRLRPQTARPALGGARPHLS